MEASIRGFDSQQSSAAQSTAYDNVKCKPRLRVGSQFEHEHRPSSEWVPKGTAYQTGYTLVYFLSLWKWVVLHWSGMMNSTLKYEHSFIQISAQSSHSSPDSEDTLSSPECEYAVSSEDERGPEESKLEHPGRREFVRRWQRRARETPETRPEHLTTETIRKKSPETRTGKLKRRTEPNKVKATQEKRRKLSENSCDSGTDSDGTGRLVIVIPSDPLSD
jgi:hypothetical protein